ncbi:L-seryl-tRNA(Sec) selenium transferase [Planctomycetes bacterium Pla163]|uniref:L-seryl-tRNA(Sec) selenium transferase n=1 Tax=Rohdeia mirabilis TaxID=2528008 RepID=A0A518CYR0_9BACT|nr:L-seryl-tRNA(Sec) selenium transferase [Planctomycetes bacterium Pla163]
MSEERASTNPYRLLPKVDALVAASTGTDLPSAVLTRLAQSVLDRLRSQIASGERSPEDFEAFARDGGVARALEDAIALERGSGLVRVINATGVVLNTGLGRAPVHPEAAEHMAEVARGYCVLEVDRFSGKRNRRDDRTSELLTRVVGGEAAIAVNNCAAAVLLALQTFAGGRSCILSRGELVEIGGSFRMPSVMERAGVELVEVGTTNRTRAADYSSAIDDHTGLLLKVHTSNYRVVGFTEEVSVAELAALGRERGLPVVYDLGSGLVDPDGAVPLDFLDDERTVAASLADGADAVLFSGDKLFGGPQAGFIVGRRAAIDAMRQNPLYRALRLDKVALAGIETTLELMLSGRGNELPARALLCARPADLKVRAERLAEQIDALASMEARVVPGRSQPGSGSAPHVFIDTFCLDVARDGWSAERLSRELRHGEPPVFARISEDRVLLDVRTLLPGDDEDLVRALTALDRQER